VVEFIVEYRKPLEIQPSMDKAVNFLITPESLQNVKDRSKIPRFRISGHLDSTVCKITEPFTGELCVEQCDAVIRSIELQLVRVETCGCAEGYARDDPCIKMKCGTGKECTIDAESGTAKCQCISKKIHTTKEDAEHLSRKWIDAIIWKFCDLDKQPHDRHVSRHELFPLRAPLLSMETCISDFLDNCDENSDHKITLVEWGKCLGASDDY
ncbi:unnamed protein product, partial [Medioppia subpectinata]